MNRHLSTARLQAPAFDTCLIITWRGEVPARELPDLPRAYAERLLEDMVAVLRPFLLKLEVVEQKADGQNGRRLRHWEAAPDELPSLPVDPPPHSSTWFEATARSFNPSEQERTTK